MLKLLKWAFWNCVYRFRVEPTDFSAYIERMLRCGWPWRRFIANAWHNNDGRQWEVHLSDCSYYVHPAKIEVECYFDQETGDVCGFTVFDEVLRHTANEQRAFMRALDSNRDDPEDGE